MEMNLTKPIVFFDVETTGLNITKDRIIQLSYVKVWPNGEEKRGDILINPEMPIPAESTAVHHLTDADVDGKPNFKQVANDIKQIFVGADIAGFNSNRFDIPMLVQEMDRAGVELDVTRCNFVDVQIIYHKNERRDLEAAYRFYCGKEMEDHHNAMCVTETTYEVFKAQLKYYGMTDVPIEKLAEEYGSHNKNVDLAGRIIYNEQGKEVFNFGKYKGQLVEEVLAKDSGYYGWMLRGDFPENTKSVLTKIKLRMAGK